ncbi:hypothetical protein [Pseudomonas sp. RGM2987]|nr:hypothetical protein [Pseudomonas sp. RGM2987]
MQPIKALAPRTPGVVPGVERLRWAVLTMHYPQLAELPLTQANA